MTTSIKVEAHESLCLLILQFCKRLFAFAVLLIIYGCDVQKDGDKVNLSVPLSRVQYPSESRLSYLPVSAGTQFVPKHVLLKNSERVFEKDGWLVFIDEMPKCDWVHSFKILYVTNVAEAGTIVFSGEAYPYFDLVKESANITNKWLKY
jgi:hypothetical protein